MSAHRYVTHAAEAAVRVWTPGDGWSVEDQMRVRWSFDSRDPAAVSMFIHCADGGTRWVFDRALIEGGLGNHGSGDVVVTRLSVVVSVSLYCPEPVSRAQLVFPAGDVDGFVERMQAVVPPDEVSYDIDGWLAELA